MTAWRDSQGLDRVDTHLSAWPSDRHHSRSATEQFRESQYASALERPSRPHRPSGLIVLIALVVAIWMACLVYRLVFG